MNNLFLLITFLACVGAVQSAAISNADVTPASLVAGASGAVTATFTTATDVPADGKFVVVFPTGFDVSSATVTGITGQTGAAGSGHTIACVSLTCTVTRGTTGTPAIFTPGVTTVSFGVVKNPTVSGNTGTFTITTQQNDGTDIDTLTTVPLVAITAGVISTASVVPADDVAGATGTAVVTFTTANPVPADGKIVITFPANYDLTGTPVAAKTSGGFDGTLTVSVASQVLTITRSGGAIAVAGAQVLSLTNIKNPATSGATGTFTITTTTATPANIDTLATVAQRTINFAVTAGAAQTIYKGATVATSGAQTANWLCWAADTTAGTVTCGVAGTATDFGATGCSAANPTSLTLTWTTVAGTHVAIKECSAANTAVGVEVDVVFTEANIAITGGAAQTIAAGSALAVTELGSGRHLCWTAATTATAITACAVAGTANDAGTSGCGAVDDASLVWTTVAKTHVSIIQCNAAVVVGSAVATVLTEQIVVASQNITAGSEVTVTGLTTGNHLCWTAGTSAGAATCAAAATATDIGTTGCGAANDAGLAWTNTNNTYIAIRECKATTNANVGVEVDFVLGEVVTTTAAPVAPATTTLSGASSEAAWSTMLTVFAIAMAVFSTL